MILKKLQLLNFKNWPEAQFNFSDKLNCFVGNNGAGKTNVLEAIHYLSVCKGYFNLVDSQNIKDEEPFFVLEGSFDKKERIHQIYCGLKRGEKKVFKKDKKQYDKLAQHIGQFPSVIISPYDRDLIMDGSEVRRKFMDGVISQSNPLYLDSLQRYNRTLQQRNALLKYFAANGTYSTSDIQVYNEQLAEKGQYIFEKRQEFLDEIAPKLLYYFEAITQKREQPEMEYASQLKELNWKQLFEKYEQRDAVNQYTGCGIHKDDLQFKINDRGVKKFGSQGQQKSFLIALKLAQYDFLKAKHGFAPLLLLDDIFDKLDEERVEQLVRLVHSENFGQIFITDTHKERTVHLAQAIDQNARIFTIDNAQLVS